MPARSAKIDESIGKFVLLRRIEACWGILWFVLATAIVPYWAWTVEWGHAALVEIAIEFVFGYLMLLCFAGFCYTRTYNPVIWRLCKRLGIRYVPRTIRVN